MIVAQITIQPAHFHHLTIFEQDRDISDALVRVLTMPFYHSETSQLRELLALYKVECVDILHPDSAIYNNMAEDMLTSLTGRKPRKAIEQLELWPL